MALNIYANGNGEEIHGRLPTECTNRRKKGGKATCNRPSTGKYDNLLWPFHGAVTIDLLNQLEDNNHQTKSLAIVVMATKSANRPPKGGRNSGYGGESLYPIQIDLKRTPSTNCQYLKDNCLYF